MRFIFIFSRAQTRDAADHCACTGQAALKTQSLDGFMNAMKFRISRVVCLRDPRLSRVPKNPVVQ